MNLSLAFTSSMTDEVLEHPINGANISLFQANQLVGQFTPSGVGQYLSDFTDYSPGDTLSFKTKLDDRLVSSTTVIPYPLNDVSIALDTVPKTRPAEQFVLEFTISFQDQSDVTNYYVVELWLRAIADQSTSNFLYRVRSDDPVITKQAYAQPLTFLTGANAITLPFTDESFNGQKRTIKFNYSPPGEESTLGGEVTVQWIMKHEIVIVFRSISKSYYEYTTSAIRHILARESDEIFGSSTPVPVVDNISGGLGVFACQHSISDTLTINKIIIN